MSSEPTGDLAAGDLGELGGQPAGQEDAAGGDAEQDHVVGALGAFDDLVGDTGQDPGDVGRFEHGRADAGATALAGVWPCGRILRSSTMGRGPPSPPHRTGVKGRRGTSATVSGGRRTAQVRDRSAPSA